MANRLSYSQLRTYSECGKKYFYHYKQGLRERTKSGALLFGTAFDKAVEAVLKDRNVDEKAIFDDIWTTQEINGKQVYLPDSTLAVYASADFDSDVLLEEDARFLKAKAKELLPDLFNEVEEDVEALYNQCKTFKSQKAFRSFKEEENKFLNLCSWCSLRRKGHLMLDEHRRYILPRIKEVKGTQVEINLDNGVGDSLLGFADLVCTWDSGETLVLDYKTSSIDYEEDSVRTSPQLTIYGHALNIKRAGFIVFKKGVKKNRTKICSICKNDGSGARHKTCANEVDGKRCNGAWIETLKPEIEIQIIIDDIPPRTEEIVMENIEVINKAINSEIFPRNFDNCIKPWGRCAFYGLCHSNDASDLEKP